ncbi:MAG: RagB/SusD family nutrient uptake outer membrane protein [Sphingobacteriales bacterium 50-39]|nr:RagB/SusD family nutrient uptake outer membrane protein [Sphingobacteriales bacterium]OJW54109.1 MAG: RagB/SusD family nutrient uptake outer membrane protein [Sphingobacteriales bacterium 50-39]
MKNKYRVYLLFVLPAVLMTACNKDFLQRNPKTEITSVEFFNSPGDLETYTNGMYYMLPASSDDLFSDNISIYNGGAELDNLIRGKISPDNVSGWDNWGDLRRINFMLDNVYKTTGDQTAINHFIGIARFFRGLFYFNMVKRYGDVPWYSHVMQTSDQAMIYKARDPRTLVVDSIMADLEFAATNISTNKNGGTNTRVTKWVAYTLLARVALYEGTFREYHTDLNLQSTAQAYLQRAATASDTIMNNGGFAVYSTGSGALDFRALFSSNSLAGNKEVIFLQRNDVKLGVANNTHVVLDWQWALSRGLANDFLMTDGTPFTSQSNYDKEGFVQMFQNRDPRMAETIMPPGFATTPGGSPYLIKPDFGGMLQVKCYPRDPALRGGWVADYTDLPIFRYAEMLLTNAEAKAELGTLTQPDLDKTVNLLRRRVGMPDLNMAGANANPDAAQAAMYPAVSGANQGVLLEIRRERRVEMACEGLRWNDLLRWKAGSLIGQPTQGIYIPALGGLDVTGDGNPDIAIWQNPQSVQPVPGLPANAPQYYLDGSSYYLSGGTSGFILFGKDQSQPRSFIDPKYYYFPIPTQQTVLNTNLKQEFGW